MTPEEETVLMIKGTIADMPAEKQQKIKAIADMLRWIVAADADNALVAMGLVGAELAAKQGK